MCVTISRVITIVTTLMLINHWQTESFAITTKEIATDMSIIETGNLTNNPWQEPHGFLWYNEEQMQKSPSHSRSRLSLEVKQEPHDQKTATEAASLIANHRNDPKYLMTLKFLSGLVTSEQGENSQKLVTRFWEAVTCNIDGVIELGIEAKINLLMHLLGQAKVKGEIDNRIPNREQILQLIDTIILKDLLAWGNQIKDSNYINDNIKQGLLEGLKQK